MNAESIVRACAAHRAGAVGRVVRAACAVGLAIFWAAGYFGAASLVGVGAPRDLSLPLESQLPCVPAFAWVYVLGFAAPFAPVFVLPEPLVARAVAAYALLIATATLIFLVFPTDGSALRSACPPDRALDMLHTADVRSNLFPSLHVGFSAMAALCLHSARSRWSRWLFGFACLQAGAVCLVKQHYFVDAVFGAALAWAAHAVAFRMAGRRQRLAN